MAQRIDGRTASEMRKIVIRPNVNPYAEGSVEVSFGNTKVHCTATVEREVPKWMDNNADSGWITAEYGMLPRSTHTRSTREAASGKQGGRTLEIQRLIGRALRRAIDLARIPQLSIRLDCDVICADGGTRTAAISGAWVALHQALNWVVAKNLITGPLQITPIAAVSVGVVSGQCILDLCYEEDSMAEFDLNLVCSASGKLIEVQGTGEQGEITHQQLDSLIKLGLDGISRIIEIQRQALAEI